MVGRENLHRCNCRGTRMQLFCRAALSSKECNLPEPVLQCIGAGSLYTCMKSKSSSVQLQWHKNAVVLPIGTEQWGVHFYKTSVAVHWCWVTARLYEQQTFIGATAVTQCYCEPVLLISSDQWGKHFTKTSVAVHWCWVTAQLYEHQNQCCSCYRRRLLQTPFSEAA